MELVLSLGAQRAEDATGFKQRGTKSFGEFPKRLAIPDSPSWGDAIKIIGWDQLGVHREGYRRCQAQLHDLLPYIPRDELDGRLHFGHDALGFLNALHAALVEPF